MALGKWPPVPLFPSHEGSTCVTKSMLVDDAQIVFFLDLPGHSQVFSPLAGYSHLRDPAGSASRNRSLGAEFERESMRESSCWPLLCGGGS